MSNLDSSYQPIESPPPPDNSIELEHSDRNRDVSTNDASTSELPHEEKPRPVIRYSRDVLLALQKSPLVKRLDELPALSVWFGEYPAKEASTRRVADGSDTEKQRPSKSMSTDKGIVLGPPKMNFASSLFGGLKQSEEKFPLPVAKASGAPSSTAGSRQRQEDTKSVKDAVNGKERTEPRAPKGPSSLGERGFTRDRSAATEKSSAFRERDNRSTAREGSVPSSSEAIERDYSSMPNRFSWKEEKTPEWMDYNPEKEEIEPKRTSKEADMKDSDGKEFINDLEAWKSRMKEQDRREKEKLRRESESKIERYTPRDSSRADSSSSWRVDKAVEVTKRNEEYAGGTSSDTASLVDDHSQDSHSRKAALANIDTLFGPGGIDLGSPLDPTSSAFDKFLLQHKTAIADETTSSIPVSQSKICDTEAASREQGGSRFARFFSSKNEGQPQHNVDAVASLSHSNVNADMSHGKPISIETLFQSQNQTTSPRLSSAPVVLASPATNEEVLRRPGQGRRMLSEEEVLMSMGARHIVKQEGLKDADDVVGFNMILQALAKAKPVVEQSSRATSLLLSPMDSSSSYSLGQSAVLQDPSIITAPATIRTFPSAKATDIPLTQLPNDPSIVGMPPPSSSGPISPQSLQLPNDPSIILAKKPDYRSQNAGDSRDPRSFMIQESRSTSNEYIQKSRPVINNLFAGNLPTSVLRQLSTKSLDASSKGSSPIFNKLHATTNKSGPNVSLPPNNSMLSPPLSMSSIPLSLQQGPQFSQAPGYFQRMPPQALGGPTSGPLHGHPPDVSQQAIGRNIPVDQFLGMVGPPPPHMRNSSPLPHLQQSQLPRGSVQATGPMPPMHMFQQQHFDRFPPPHMLPPGPPQLPGPGPLPPHMQHAAMQSRLPMHPDMMPPPDILHASIAGYANMIPPNIMNNGLPGGPGLPPHFFQHAPGMPPAGVNMNPRMVFEEYERGGGPRS
ncbi:hypothetical protein BC937DRAFT_95467 [Endogone sp. FLAS-F59071]|nr:hypothetical protein BC937DRAFT_95467 [Endogone sp. FLAS-F59071]|eukprot:RUS20337.1 hypothetical protein BC937DRAFT_95467 [Endogone sp. FLAS-F59071]